MKNSILILLVLVGLNNSAGAQDIFQRYLYSPEVIMKYREEAGISSDQVEKIKNIYSTGLSAYNSKQWDLSAAMAKLEKLISQSSIDGQAADSQLDKTLALEAELKKMRLATLGSIKNILTPAQQTKLDAHKGEFVSENSLIAPLNDNHSATVKIRSLVGTKPLYILVDGDTKKETDIELLALLNPNDIESIEVLKNGDSTALYGKKGNNGVIIVTLKKKK